MNLRWPEGFGESRIRQPLTDCVCGPFPHSMSFWDIILSTQASAFRFFVCFLSLFTLGRPSNKWFCCARMFQNYVRSRVKK